MTLLIFCIVAIVFLLLWVAFLEYRQHKTNGAILQIIESAQTLTNSLQAHNNAIHAQGLKNQAIINAVNAHANDIMHIVCAVNRISQEVKNDDILQTPEKPTIQ